MDLVYLFRVLFKRKWIILAAAVIAAGMAYFFTRNEPRNFRSSTVVSTGFGVPDEIRLSDERYNYFDAELKFNNAISTWTSPTVISLLSYELILHDLKNPKTAFRRLTEKQLETDWYKQIKIDSAIRIFEEKLATMSVLTSFKPEEKKLLELLKLYGYGYSNIMQRLTINWQQRTDYIHIDCVSENPDLSAFVVNNVFQQFIRYYKGIRDSKSQQSIDTLESIMLKKKQEYDLKNQMLRGEGGGDVSNESSSKYELMADLEKTLATEKSKQTDNYYSLRKINQRIANLGTGTSTTPNSNNNEELIIARKAMNDAYAEYLKTNSASDLARYNQLKTEYNNKVAGSKIVNNTPERGTETKAELLNQKNDLELDIDASNVKIRELENRISSVKANANAITARGANVESLMDEVKLAEREYLDAKSKYNSAYEQSSASANNFRQLQIAQPAIEPEPSKRKMIVAIAGIVAMMSTILFITILTYLDSSIKTPTIFSKTVDLKLISMVNFMNLKKKELRDIVAGKNLETSKAEKKRSNVFRESIRKLRYEVEKSGHKIFLFTSTKKGMGKTTLIQALSYSFSLSNKKVLVIDTNFCNNDLTVQMDATPILEKIAAEGDSQSFSNYIKSVAKEIDGGNIYVIGSEGGDYTPSEILPKENILDKLHLLAPEFDYIFLEGPPLNDFTDSKELLHYVDSVIAIFSATHIIKQIDKESIQFFKEINGKFCGSVLNKVDLENVNAI